MHPASTTAFLTPWWMPPNASLEGRAVDSQMLLSLASMAALLLVAQAVLLLATLRPAPLPTSGTRAKAYSRWALLTLLTVVVLFCFLAVRAENLWAANRFQGPSYDALQVEVVGQQFQWYFRYPGADAAFGSVRSDLVDPAAGNPLGIDPQDPRSADDFVTSTLELPAGREVNLRLRSLDVIHGLFIPAMRVKQNALPGSLYNIHFTPQAPGSYQIVCSQVCGTGHFRMGAELKVVTPQQYSAWLAAHAKHGVQP